MTAKHLTAIVVLASCTSQPAPAASQDAKPTPEAPAAAEKDAPIVPEKIATPAPAKECCFYCFEGTPCGESCVTDGSECKTETTCACPASQRRTPAFKKGERALAGIIRTDVAAYNKAQGDPIDGDFTLTMAFEGDPALADKEAGKLWATIETDLGNLECEMYEDRAPLTVANFVGLARGTRPWYDTKTKAWKTDPYYSNILIHRVIANFMIQMGDHTGSGSGGPGFFVPDEFHPELKHTGAGILSMANRNKVDPRTQKLKVDPKTGQHIGNTGASQFFVTVRKTPHLDGRHTVFGKCNDKVALEIAKVPTRKGPPPRGDRPIEPVRMKRVTFSRKK